MQDILLKENSPCSENEKEYIAMETCHSRFGQNAGKQKMVPTQDLGKRKMFQLK